MPISEADGCSENHWAEVFSIISDAVTLAGFVPNLVSNADDVGVIHKNIIQNLYANPMVICDVSAKNPNVMFELGLRLAFDKPTIIIKDHKTEYSFDTSAIEHLAYPRDLRFSKIVDFKKRLSEKISATHKRASEDPNYTTFLKHFGEFKVAKIESKEVSVDDLLFDEIRQIKSMIRASSVSRSGSNSGVIKFGRRHFDYDDSDIEFYYEEKKYVDAAFSGDLPVAIRRTYSDVESVSCVRNGEGVDVKINLKKGADVGKMPEEIGEFIEEFSSIGW